MENAEEYAKIPRPRKRKVIFSKEQTACLEGVFKVSRYPDITVIEGLAQEIGVAMEKISNWFQNKRAREKRNQAADHRKWMKEQFYQSQAAIHAQGDHVISPRQSAQGGGVYPNGLQSPYGSYERKPSIMDAFQYELNGSACRYPPQMPPMPLAPLLPHNPIVPSGLSPTLPTYSKHYGATNLASAMTSQYPKAYVPPSLSPTADYSKLYGQQDYGQSARSPGMALPHDPTMTSPNHVDVTSPLTPQMQDPRSPQSEVSEDLSPECSTPAVIRSYGGGRPHWPVSPLSQPTSPEQHEPPSVYRPVFVHPEYLQTSRTSPITSLPSPTMTSLPNLHIPTSLASLGLPYPTTSNLTSYAPLTSSISPLPTFPTPLASMSMPFPTTTTTTTTSDLSPLPVGATSSYASRTPSTSLPNSYWYNAAAHDVRNVNSTHNLAADMNYYYQTSAQNYHNQPSASLPLRHYEPTSNYPPMTSSLTYPSPTNQTPSYMGQCHIGPY